MDNAISQPYLFRCWPGGRWCFGFCVGGCGLHAPEVATIGRGGESWRCARSELISKCYIHALLLVLGNALTDLKLSRVCISESGYWISQEPVAIHLLTSTNDNDSDVAAVKRPAQQDWVQDR